MAAYAAAAGIEAHIFMPRDVPQSNFIECCATGAKVTLVDGLISDCGKMVAARKDAEGWFEICTLKEPYRIEGKKTMGYELAEQFALAVAGRDLLSVRRRRGDDRHVEGVRGNGNAGLDRIQTSQDDRRAGRGLRARSCARSSKASSAATSSKMPKPSRAGCAFPRLWAIFWFLSAARESGGTAIAVSDEEMIEAGDRTGER